MSKIKLSNVRINYPSLFRKAQFMGVEGKFEATFLLSKDEHSDLIKILEDEIKLGIKENFKGEKLPADKICLKEVDGDEFLKIKATSNKNVTVVGRDKTPITEESNKIYGGCYVNAVIELWFQNNQFGKRVNANLLGVQFFADGQPFGDASGITENDFETYDENMFD